MPNFWDTNSDGAESRPDNRGRSWEWPLEEAARHRDEADRAAARELEHKTWINQVCTLIVSEYTGYCRGCGEHYVRGDTIWWAKGHGVQACTFCHNQGE